MSNPFRAAQRVLDELGINDPKDLALLDLIAWERGALVRQMPLPLEGAEARLSVVGRRAIITVSTSIEDPRRSRFSTAHELGHLEMHHRTTPLTLCLSEDINDWGSHPSGVNLEREANEFASALLLPERFFAHLCQEREPSLDYISQLAHTFNVSLTATALRYLQFSDEPLAVVFSQDSQIEWFRGSRDFQELREDLGVFVDVRSRLDPSSHAAKFFQGESVPMGPKPVDACAWFLPGRYRSDATIQEESVAMPTYNAVLTLLWVDEDIEQESDFLWP